MRTYIVYAGICELQWQGQPVFTTLAELHTQAENEEEAAAKWHATFLASEKSDLDMSTFKVLDVERDCPELMSSYQEGKRIFSDARRQL